MLKLHAKTEISSQQHNQITFLFHNYNDTFQNTPLHYHFTFRSGTKMGNNDYCFNVLLDTYTHTHTHTHTYAHNEDKHRYQNTHSHTHMHTHTSTYTMQLRHTHIVHTHCAL